MAVVAANFQKSHARKPSLEGNLFDGVEVGEEGHFASHGFAGGELAVDSEVTLAAQAATTETKT